MEYILEEYYTPGEDFYTFSEEDNPDMYDNPYRKWSDGYKGVSINTELNGMD